MKPAQTGIFIFQLNVSLTFSRALTFPNEIKFEILASGAKHFFFEIVAR